MHQAIQQIKLTVANYSTGDWQAIVKHWDDRKPWAVAVRKDPFLALHSAIAKFNKMYRGDKNPWK